jgi:hypothetical protein
MAAVCPICGRHVTDLVAHNAEMALRRQRYGASWELTKAKRYETVADDSDSRDEAE